MNESMLISCTYFSDSQHGWKIAKTHRGQLLISQWVHGSLVYCKPVPLRTTRQRLFRDGKKTRKARQTMGNRRNWMVLKALSHWAGHQDGLDDHQAMLSVQVRV